MATKRACRDQLAISFIVPRSLELDMSHYSLRAHVEIQLHLIWKLSKGQHSNVRNKNGRTYPVTLIMTNYSTADQDHIDTMNDITPITHTESAAAKKATARQRRIHRATNSALAEFSVSVREKDMEAASRTARETQRGDHHYFVAAIFVVVYRWKSVSPEQNGSLMCNYKVCKR